MTGGREPAATRVLLLDCAEQLIAERGVHGVSMREIGLAAGQRNNGVTQYHFGTKDGLLQAVFERRARTVDEQRLALLDVHAQPTVHDLVEAYVVPLAEQVRIGTWYVPFLSRLQAEHARDDLLQDVAGVNQAYVRIRDGVRSTALAGLSTRQFAIRWRIAINLAIDALADHQHASAEGRTKVSLAIFQAELIDVITAILGG